MVKVNDAKHLAGSKDNRKLRPAAGLTVLEALEKATKREIESQHLYTNLSHKMNDQAVKEACINLFHEEQKHQNILERYLKGETKDGALRGEQVLDYKIAEHLDQPEETPDMELKDIFLLAAYCEKASYEFYVSLAEAHPPGQIRDLLVKIASQEMKHKQKVEFLYTEVAFPQTDGG